MPVTCMEENRCLTAAVSGELDHHRAREIMEELDRQIDAALPRKLTLDLSGLTFTDSSKLTVNFNEGGSLWLDEFTVERGGGWANNLDENSMLTLVNFSNYLLHVKSFREEDDLSRIFAEGFEEGSFRWEPDTINGGYWLVGTAIPEPAAMAAVFGSIALALAALRKRK